MRGSLRSLAITFNRVKQAQTELGALATLDAVVEWVVDDAERECQLELQQASLVLDDVAVSRIRNTIEAMRLV